MLSKKERKKKEDDLLLRQIRATQEALDSAYAGFDHVTEPDLIDSYIYELNAISLRYKFLLQTAKSRQKHYSTAYTNDLAAH